MMFQIPSRGLGDENSTVDLTFFGDPSVGGTPIVPNTPTPVYDDAGNITSYLPAGTSAVGLNFTPASLQAQNPGLTGDQIAKIIAASASGALNIFRQTSTPGIVPGTNLVYNPATGQFLPASGVGLTAQQVSSSAIPLGLAAVAGLVLLMMVMKK